MRMESDATVASDGLDLRLLHALETDGRAAFSRIADVLGVSDQTIARRYRRLLTDAGARVVAVRDPQRLGLQDWMLRLRCVPEAAETVASALARRPDTAWIALSSGGTEIIVQTRPRTRGEHDELLLGKLPRTPQIKDIRAQQVLHRFFGGPQGWLGKSGALTPDEVAQLLPSYVTERPPTYESDGPARIPAEDEPLVAALELDGRATYPELQRATGRSESAVKRRLAALLASGAIFIDVEWDSEPFGFPDGTLLAITVAPRHLDAVGRALATHPEVAFAAATTGSTNLEVVAVTRDSAHLYRYLSGALGTLEGVLHVETLPMHRRVKQLTYKK
jgi:DNA-binding Lrp family transcriptional regulator